MYTKSVGQGDNHGDLRWFWPTLCGDTHQGARQQWVKKKEENNHASEAVLCADFKHWMPLCISAEKPTRGRIQITTDFILAKTSSKQRLPGDLDSDSLYWNWWKCALCCSWQEQMIKIQVSQEW